MAFDPNRPSTLVSGGFDPTRPSTLIEEPSFGFDPNRPSILIDEDPTLGQIGTGLVAEIGIGEGAKFAGATAGAAIGTTFLPFVGTAVGAGLGYVVGGLSGGISGSIAAQRLEGREDISWGRVTADTILNLLPFGAGKVTKGAKVIPRLVGAGLRRGA